MSQFECINHHYIPVGHMGCPECGEPVAYMDGMSNWEWREMAGLEDEEETGEED